MTIHPEFRDHRLLPVGFLLLDRASGGSDLAVVEVVDVGPSPDRERFERVLHDQRQGARPGSAGEHARGVLVQQWGSRRRSPTDLALRRARRQPLDLTERIKVWQGNLVVARQIHHIVRRAASFDDVLRFVVQQLPRS